MSTSNLKAPSPGGESGASPKVYTKEDLERELKRVEEKVSHILELWEDASRGLFRLWRYLSYSEGDLDIVNELYDRARDLETLVYDIVDTVITRELGLDVDLDKYNVKYETERVLGVVLVRDGDSITPVVICTDYKRIYYYELLRG
jgi:hypothetical protein